MVDINSLHRREYGASAEVIVSAPGVVTLLGEQTDYNEGFILQFGLNKRVEVAVSRRKDSSLRFYAADFEERKRSSISNLKYKREDRWANYPKGVVVEFLEDGYKIKKGLNFTIRGEIPLEVGLASSSALCTAAAYALRSLFDAQIGDKECLEYAMRAESAFLGKNATISDHMTSALSKKDRALFIDIRGLEYEYIPFSASGIVILLTLANVPLVSTETDMEMRRDECRRCVEYLRDQSGGDTLRDYTAEDIKLSLGVVPETTRRLCLHVVEENERVQDGKEALLKNDLALFGKILSKSHESLRDNYEVSCPEIDWLVKRAWELDEVLGARLTGTGHSSCTITLLEEKALPLYYERLEEYERIFGFNAETIICRPDEGVRYLPVSENQQA